MFHGSKREERNPGRFRRRRILQHALVVLAARVIDLEQQFPGNPVPVRARLRELGVQIGQPAVEILLGGLGESHRAEWQHDHARAFSGTRHMQGSARSVQ